MATNLAERRVYPRIQFKAPLSYQIRGTPSTNNTVSEDLSTGGLCFISDKFLPPATKLMLQVNILSRMLNPVAEVAWTAPIRHCNNYRVGIRFVEIENHDRNYLNDYVNMQRGALV